MRRIPLGALALFAAQAMAAGRAAHADESPPPLPMQLTVDLDAASIGVTYASRVRSSGILIGAGAGVGLSPILGTTFATGNHYDAAPNVHLLEVVNLQLFVRAELASWLRVDVGGRGGVFIHGSETFTGGQFAALFLAPALVWRWLWIGPRISAGALTEGINNKAGAVAIDYVMLRLVRSW
jgi:hypothetical protein